ncbi:MAG: ABC transporter permease [Pseudomonadota bacterium]
MSAAAAGPSATLSTDGPNGRAVNVSGAWVFGRLPAMQRELDSLALDSPGPLTYRCDGVEAIDLSGAWLLHRHAEALAKHGVEARFDGFKAEHFKYLREVQRRAERPPPPPPRPGLFGRAALWLESLGARVVGMLHDTGEVIVHGTLATWRPNRLGLRETAEQLNRAGTGALPIVTVIAFLMGAVLAYQGARQLRTFGAEIFTIDLVAISLWREMAPLLTAILVAGRSGSAFATTLGVMKINEELDALRVIGVDPMRALVGPRIVALVIALPVLTLVADVVGLVGASLLASLTLDISTAQFLNRLAVAVDWRDLVTGLVKAPIFAIIIAGIGTLRGLQVSGSAEELGRLTTRAVVESIAVVIVANGIFSILFAELGL